MLKKQREKTEKVKDVAYYVQKIKDLQEGVRSTSVMVQNDISCTEVWSSGSDDEVVRKATHGRCLMVKTANMKNSNVDSQATVAEQVTSVFRNNKILTPNHLIIDEISRYYRI